MIPWGEASFNAAREVIRFVWVGMDMCKEDLITTDLLSEVIQEFFEWRCNGTGCIMCQEMPCNVPVARARHYS